MQVIKKNKNKKNKIGTAQNLVFFWNENEWTIAD